MSQHYRVTLSEAIAHYQNGDLTAKGLLHFYLKIRLKDGWVLKESPKEIYTKLGISRAAFYNALSRLKAEGSVDWSVPDHTPFSIKLAVCECRQESTIVDEPSMDVDKLSTIVDEPSRNVDKPSRNVDKKLPEPLPDKESSAPSDLSQIYSTYLNSLPTRERETFLNFARSKAHQLPEPPQLIEKWIAANLNWVKEEFDKAYPKELPDSGPGQGSAPPNSDEKNDLHPEIEAGLADGRIRNLDPAFNGLHDAEGIWWKVDEWIEKATSGGDDANTPNDCDKHRAQVKEWLAQALSNNPDDNTEPASLTPILKPQEVS